MAVNLVVARREMAEMATVILMAGVIFDSPPARTLKAGVTVMLERTVTNCRRWSSSGRVSSGWWG